VKKAKYVAFEGIDGSGKTKQLELLKKYLEDSQFSTLVTRELGSPHNKACTQMRQLFLDSNFDLDPIASQFLLASSSSHHSEKVLKQNIEKYDFILSDRSVESNIAYGIAMGAPSDLILSLFSLDKRRLYPDFVIYLDITPEVSFSRTKKREQEIFNTGGIDRIELKGIELQKKVREEYLFRSENKSPSKYIIVDASLSIEGLHQNILDRLKDEKLFE